MADGSETKTTRLGRIESSDGNRQRYFALLELVEPFEEMPMLDTKSSVNIVLTDVASKAWKGTLDADFVNLHAKRTKYTVEKYLSMTIACLTEKTLEPVLTSVPRGELEADMDVQMDVGCKYVCLVKELHNGDAELTWKRVLVAQDISVKLGTATLQRSELADCLRTILEFGVSRIRELELMTKQQQIMEKIQARERTTILEKFDECVTAKEQMERDLYSKFVAVLNEKKSEIRRLSASPKRKAVEVEQCPAPNTEAVSKAPNKKTVKKKIWLVAEPDSDELLDDDEDAETPTIERVKKPDMPRLSNRSRMTREDLMLDDDDDDNTDVDGNLDEDSTSDMMSAANYKRTLNKPSAATNSSTSGFVQDVDRCAAGPSTSSEWAPRSSTIKDIHGDETLDSEALFDEM